jgi:hypothetical protein
LSGYAAEEANPDGESTWWGVAKATAAEVKARVEDQARELSALIADVGYEFIESGMPFELRAAAQKAGMHHAESALGTALQQGIPITTIVVEQVDAIRRAPANLVNALTDPESSDRDIARALVDAAEAAAALVAVGKTALRIGRRVGRLVGDGIETADRARITLDLLRYRRQSTGSLRDLRTLEDKTVKPTGKFAGADAWKLAGACVKYSECIVSGGLTAPSWRNVFSNLFAERSLGHGGYDFEKGKLKGDIDFHVRKPGLPYFYDTDLAAKLSREVAELFDDTEMHGVMGMDIPPAVLGSKTTGMNRLRADYVMRRIRWGAPDYISKDGNVRTDKYLGQGLQMSAGTASWLSKGEVTKAGRYALIFKHGKDPVLRPANPDLVMYRALPRLNLRALDRLDTAFQPIPFKLGLFPMLGSSDDDSR